MDEARQPSQLHHPLIAIGLGCSALVLCLWLVTDRRLAGPTDVGDALGMATATALMLGSLLLSGRAAFVRLPAAGMTLLTCLTFASIVLTVVIAGVSG